MFHSYEQEFISSITCWLISIRSIDGKNVNAYTYIKYRLKNIFLFSFWLLFEIHYFRTCKTMFRCKCWNDTNTKDKPKTYRENYWQKRQRNEKMKFTVLFRNFVIRTEIKLLQQNIKLNNISSCLYRITVKWQKKTLKRINTH